MKYPNLVVGLNFDQNTLIDLEDYIRVKENMIDAYEDRKAWSKMTLVNIAKAGYFSSDRTIADYERDIWRTK